MDRAAQHLRLAGGQQRDQLLRNFRRDHRGDAVDVSFGVQFDQVRGDDAAPARYRREDVEDVKMTVTNYDSRTSRIVSSCEVSGRARPRRRMTSQTRPCGEFLKQKHAPTKVEHAPMKSRGSPKRLPLDHRPSKRPSDRTKPD